MRAILNAVFMIALCFMSLPGISNATAVSQNEKTGVFMTEPVDEWTDSLYAVDGQMLLQADCRCDLPMLIPVEADNDPGFQLDS